MAAQHMPVSPPAAALPPRPAGLGAGARPFVVARSGGRRPIAAHRAVLSAVRDASVAAPRSPSAPELEVDSGLSAAAAQPQSLELPSLSEADITARQPEQSDFSLKRQQRKEARHRWAPAWKGATTTPCDSLHAAPLADPLTMPGTRMTTDARSYGSCSGTRLVRSHRCHCHFCAHGHHSTLPLAAGSRWCTRSAPSPPAWA